MKITKGEFCQFSLSGRLEFLDLYGEYICCKVFETKKVIIFRVCDFHVVVLEDLHSKSILDANPILPNRLLEFYSS